MRRRRGRPMGEISSALLRAWEHGPCTVREAAALAQVGFEAARFRASNLVARGHLVPVDDGKPRRLALVDAEPAEPAPSQAAFLIMARISSMR